MIEEPNSYPARQQVLIIEDLISKIFLIMSEFLVPSRFDVCDKSSFHGISLTDEIIIVLSVMVLKKRAPIQAGII